MSRSITLHELNHVCVDQLKGLFIVVKKIFGRALFVGAAAVASLALTAGTASAHFCYKTNENPNAAAGKAGSSNWASFSDLVAINLGPLCDEGVQLLADAAGATPSTLINTHGTMAGGTLKKEEPGTNSISYLNFDGLFAAIPDAFIACGLEPPPLEEE